MFFERVMARWATREEVRFECLAFRPIQRAGSIERNRFFELFVRHPISPCSQQRRRLSRSLDIPSLILVLTVPSG